MLLWTGSDDPGGSARDEARDTPRARERARRPRAGAADGSAGGTAASPEETAKRDEPVLVMRVRDPNGSALRTYSPRNSSISSMSVAARSAVKPLERTTPFLSITIVQGVPPVP